MGAIYGWCDNSAHNGEDHRKSDTCTDFISDADFTAQMLSEDDKARIAARYDDGGASARYVAQYLSY